MMAAAAPSLTPEQSSEEHLVVNERSLPMLRGWKDQDDYLMNEDVDALHALLTTRCTLTPEPVDTDDESE